MAEVFGKYVGLFIFIIITSMVFAIPTYLLWNWLMPVVFGVTKITFFQAIGVNMFSGCIFSDLSLK